MKFRQIRNATIHIEYAGKKFLVDPMLAPKGSYPGFEGTVNSHIKNPTVDLPLSMDEILDVDAVIVTHTHPDHWDEAAQLHIPKNMLIFTQHDQDAEIVKSAGFTNTFVLSEKTEFGDITLIKTAGQHGRDEAIAHPQFGPVLGEVCGIVFQHSSEPVLYIAGDTVWCALIEKNLQKYSPEVVVLNIGDAQASAIGSIIMGKQDVFEVLEIVPKATLICSHMESVNHAVLSRRELLEAVNEKSLAQSILVPDDGEEYSLEK